MSKQIDFLVKLRDAALMMADAANEYIESMAPPEVTASDKEDKKYDANKIKWEKTTGLKGEYERSEDLNSMDFKAMLKDLTAHQGKLTRDGYFYWLFKNGATIGRKKQKTEVRASQ
ncbi:hypothetical protein G4O51_09600 [Candidatus Bathyarchaeota archaeon A05DMB-2]|jgi:uncharacterized protein YchJ|nr:hypothetical protein [Candidatus Bathyarchaeota archaeon A05DMB-2]